MGHCDMCSSPVDGDSTLHFTGPDKGELVAVDLHLCTECGERISKHLKRAIPSWKELRRPLRHGVVMS